MLVGKALGRSCRGISESSESSERWRRWRLVSKEYVLN